MRTAARKLTPNVLLARQRKARDWTEDDVATGLHRLAATLGEPEPGVDANTVGRWERGVQRPSRLYALLLCLLFEAPPRQIGLVATPWLEAEFARLSSSSIRPVLDRTPTGDPSSASLARASRMARALVERSEAVLPFRPNAVFDRELLTFLRGSSRVLLMEGALGVGKTTLCCHVVHSPPAGVTVQLHLVWHIDHRTFDLAAAILRYADVRIETDDPLRGLERLVEGSTDAWLVMVDGVSDVIQWQSLSRELDRILSHVGSSRLRFLVAHRSLPDLRVTEYPIMSALTHIPSETRSAGASASFRVEPWTASETHAVWETGRADGAPPFDTLARPLQHLLRWPLHMRLARESLSRSNGAMADIPSLFELVDTSISTAFAKVGADQEMCLLSMQALAQALYDDQFHLRSDAPPGSTQPSEAGLLAAIDAEIVVVGTRPGRRHLAFAHDLFAEYSLALSCMREIGEQADAIDAMSVLNGIARSSETSATAQGVLELTILGLASREREVWRRVVAVIHRRVSSLTTACLPTVVRLQCRGADLIDARDVECLLALSASQGQLRLARSLLECPALVRELPVPIVARWLLDVLRGFGSVLWWEIRAFLNGPAVTHALASALLAAAEMDDPDQARLVAHLAPRMGGDDPARSRTLASLRNHPDWQVRAALVSALAEARALGDETEDALSRYLHQHEDYKVRAAAGRASAAIWNRSPLLVLELLRDHNWHVRNAVLESARELPGVELAELVRSVSWEEWRAAPVDARANAWEILLLAMVSDPPALPEDEAFDRALFRLLREGVTGARVHEAAVANWLVERAVDSADPVVRREAERYAAAAGDQRYTCAWDAGSFRADFRRLRGRRAVQIALDCTDMAWALRVARAADAAGADFIEVGDPLIKRLGVGAISVIREVAPSSRIVAEMISTDWGRDQVEHAAFRGADVVLLIGPASQASLQRAIARANALGMILVLDVPAQQASEEWCSSVQAAGVDGFVVTTNIDVGMHGPYPLHLASRIRRWTELPVGASGGFSEMELGSARQADCDIVIVGRSVVDALDPEAAARRVCEAVRSAR